MYTLEKIKKNIALQISKVLGLEIGPESLVYPPKREMGDLSLPVFTFAKEAKKSPGQLSQLLVSKIRDKSISSSSAAGPYYNVKLNFQELAKSVISEIRKDKDAYGRNKSGKKKKVMIEYSNANTHKEYHIGHLRNICFGDAVQRILAANGYETIPVSYINDFGIHTAKTLWNWPRFQHKHKDVDLSALTNAERGYYLGKCYQEAASRSKGKPTAKQEIEFVMKRIESRSGAEYELWRKTRQWSIDYFASIYSELGVEFRKTYYESDLLEKGKDIAAELYERRILTKSDGAIIADLEDKGLGVLLFIRSDGTALYAVADLALARAKSDLAGISIYVVDVRQSLHFKQLFEVLRRAGNTQELVHLGYDFVKLPEGMMSSREGTAITYNDLREALNKNTTAETKERHGDWGPDKIENVGREITRGVMKFEMLKMGPDQVINFDMDKALGFSGYTSAYLQYTYARINSMTGKEGVGKFAAVEMSAEEKTLLMGLAKYPEAVKRAGAEYDPSEIAKYLFELARDYNDFYHKLPVLKAEAKTRDLRLALSASVAQTIKNGLNLLGIGVVEEM